MELISPVHRAGVPPVFDFETIERRATAMAWEVERAGNADPESPWTYAVEITSPTGKLILRDDGLAIQEGDVSPMKLLFAKIEPIEIVVAQRGDGWVGTIVEGVVLFRKGPHSGTDQWAELEFSLATRQITRDAVPACFQGHERAIIHLEMAGLIGRIMMSLDQADSLKED